MKAVLAVATVAFLLAGSTAFGAVITMDTATPSGVISQTAHTTGSDLLWRADYDGHQYLGQTFTANSSTVGAVSVMIRQEADRMLAGMDITMKLWDAAGNVAAESGTILATAQGLTPAFTPNTYQWMTFDLPDTAVTAGQIYGFTVDFTMSGSAYGPLGGHRIGGDEPAGVQYAGNQYASGQAFRITNGASTFDGNQDLTFVVTQVPEPATMSLLGLGAVGALIRRRK